MASYFLLSNYNVLFSVSYGSRWLPAHCRRHLSEYYFVQATYTSCSSDVREPRCGQPWYRCNYNPCYRVSLNKPCKVVPVNAVKEYKGNQGREPLNFNLSTRWSWVISLMLRPLYLQENSPRYPHNRRLSVHQRRLGRFTEKENTLHLLEFEPWIVQSVV